MQEMFKKLQLVSKPESKVEKTVRTLIAKKMEEQDNLNYTLLGSFKVVNHTDAHSRLFD